MLKKTSIFIFCLFLIAFACSKDKSNNPGNTAPAAPTNLTGVGATATSIQLAWADNSINETGFSINRAIQTGAFSQIATVASNISTYTDTQLSHGISYRYYVTAVNSVGASAASNTISAHTLNQAPTMPANPNPPNGYNSVPPTEGLFPTWSCSDPDGDSISYSAYYGTANPPPFFGALPESYFDAGSMSAGTTYYWKVVAYDQTDSTVGPVWSFMTQDVEFALDDGMAGNAYYWYDYHNLSANMFTPSAWPVIIDSVLIRVYTVGDPYWPWPDPTADPVVISIFSDDGSGMPRTNPIYSTQVTGQLGQWIRAAIPDISITSGSFWVAMANVYGGGEEGLCLDAVTDYPHNKWSRINGVWWYETSYDGDQMIRAKVYGDGVSGQWIGGNDRPPERPSSDTKGKATSVLMQNK